MDSGAKVDAKPEHMVQSAIMGTVYAEKILKISEPKVGLLNIGEEETKGNEQALATYPLLKRAGNIINFIGNVEGRDINKGTVDVVVCDGFVGNVVLKFGEGLAGAIMTLVKEAIMSGGIFAKLGGLLIKPALRKLKSVLTLLNMVELCYLVSVLRLLFVTEALRRRQLQMQFMWQWNLLTKMSYILLLTKLQNLRKEMGNQTNDKSCWYFRLRTLCS